MRIALVVLAAVAAALLVALLIRPSGDARDTAGPAAGQLPVPVGGTARVQLELPDDVAGWAAAGPVARYDPQSIYAYIDGHAEVYLAYGMRGCTSRRYTGPAGEADLVADVFELASPADAFGVFTHDRDGESVDVGEAGLFRFGWLSFWKGRYFVSIVTESETLASKQAAIELGRALAGELPSEGSAPAIMQALPREGLNAGTTRFLRHPQILNTHVFVSDENLLELGPETAGALGMYRRGDARAYLLLVDYPDEARARRAEARFRAGMLEGAVDPVSVEGRGHFAAGRTGSRVALVIGADSADLARALLAGASGSGVPGGVP